MYSTYKYHNTVLSYTVSFFNLVSLLSGARINHNSDLSEKIYNRMKNLFPDEKKSLSSGVVLLSNVYSSLGDYEKAKSFRSNQIKELGLKVQVGISWTEINGQIVVSCFSNITFK